MIRSLLVLLLCGLPAGALAASESWLVTTDLWGNPAYQLLTLERAGKRLTGELDGDRLEGERAGNVVHFVVTDSRQQTYVFDGKVSSDGLRGTADYPDSNNPKARVAHAFTARLLPVRPAGPPRVHDFTPTTWSNEFTAHRLPVLTVWPGDTVRTSTLDSGGMDAKGVTRALFGNPQTGPFFIATANPGDTLAIHIRRLKPNRPFADSLDSIVGRALTPGLAAKAAGLGKPVRWTLDLERGVARPETPTERLRAFSVPLRPMLGGVAVAQGFGSAPLSTGDTGRYGGNMDFNEVVEGNTVYLPVAQPGALLYLGDAHAAQGDGETSQYALETSMDVEFTVDVLHGKPPPSTPRVESPTHLMALGQGGSLDDALRSATQGLAQWLEQDYGLTLSESAQVLGSSVQYVVANLAGRSVGVAAKLDKVRLEALRPPAK
ncbi:acetamidase/formamidase family protein [Corallococcus sp. Z5C101001]|uniref:acetamidase/formamidase family protein n=1 Tax=Corallococcus sp. Z5C101001 TaxID=2596829 RepID=UPI00117C8F7A|nr:acetamidase/formamidase family protein [Corallococcus sp. Z5C101001]TSC34160.1 acetamidase [Corallococcus sp. Z5C101001]